MQQKTKDKSLGRLSGAWPPSLSVLDDWPATPRDAIELQRQLASRIKECPLVERPLLIASVDVSHERFSSDLHAAAVLERFDPATQGFESVAVGVYADRARFPYVPGFLSFREVPVVLPALAALPIRPDLVICDGQGKAHPRRFGLACHLGVLIDVPSLGCAKSLLVGKHEELDDLRGSVVPLVHNDEVVGMAVRTRNKCKPVFVSVGNRLTLADAVACILTLTDGRCRLSLPQRRAHIEANVLRKAARSD